MSIAEIRKDAYDFQREILLGGLKQQDWEDRG